MHAKKTSIPATSDAKSKGQSLPNAEKHDFKRDDTLKQGKYGFYFSSADESESTLVSSKKSLL